MIDWNVLIKPENVDPIPGNDAKSRNKSGFVGTENAQCRNSESEHSCGSSDFVPTVPTVPTYFQGGRKEKENHAPGEWVATDNFSAAKTHPINPIAVTLLLTCCNKATVTKEEILEAIWKLQTMPQPEQIRSWAILCLKHGVDPYRVIHPFAKAANQGKGCQGCMNMDMQKIQTDKRPVYRFICGKQHHMLEAFHIGERVLIAPESCNDYRSKA